jgi:hypothetical protein
MADQVLRPPCGITLALASAHSACQDRTLIVVDRRREFYPAGWGIELSRIVGIELSSNRRKCLRLTSMRQAGGGGFCEEEVQLFSPGG